MEITTVFCPPDRQAWRSWLHERHLAAPEIWLRVYNKASGMPRVAYDDAVEEALCYGWIDGITKKYCDHSSVQRYTPRRPKSWLSELNRQRMFKLIAQGLMTPAGLAAVGDKLGSPDDPLIIPADVQAALQADPPVWENFCRFPLVYQKIRIGFVVECRRLRLAESDKRLAYLIKMTRQNKQYGTMVEW